MPKMPATRRTRYKRRPRLTNRVYINRQADAAPQNQMSRFISSFNPFPAVHYATLRYCTNITLVVTTASQASTHYFRANSIHDPDYSGTVFGGQPYGHDTYSNIYNHYQVLGSTITVQGNPANNTRYFGVGCLLQDNATIIEDESRQLCAMKGSSYTRQGNGSMATIKRSFDTNFMVNKSTQCAPFGSDVNDPMYFVVFSMDDGETGNVLYCTVTINYRVKMWELKDLSST